MERGEPMDVPEYRVVWPDGSTRFHRAIGEAHFGPDGEAYEIVGATMDVTEAVRARHALQTIIEEAPLPLIMADAHGKVILANRVTEQVLGWAADELTGQDVAVLAADGEIAHHQYMEHFNATGRASTPEGLVVGRSREVLAQRRDGSTFPADLAVSAFEADDGQRRYLAILLDASARKAAEEEAQRAQHWEALGTLVAGVAHDFNNLLTGIVGGLSLLREDPENVHWLDVAERSAARASALVQQLLRFGRPSDGDLRWFEPAPVVEHAVSLARETFWRGIELRLEVQPVPAGVFGDGTQFDQVMLNLLVNARDAVLERANVSGDPAYVPRIDVRVSTGVLQGAAAVSVRVSDNGIGMSPDVRARAFDPFFSTKREGAGTGLGLALLQGIVQAFRGAITLETAPMVGSTLDLLFPLVPETRTEAAVAAPADAAPSQPTQPSWQVLVVDDEEIVGDIAATYLRGAGFTTSLVTSGAEALRLLEAEPRPDLVLLDANMPSPNGWDVLARIRAGAGAPPVVMMSGLESADDATAHGAAGYVEKPFTRQSLVSAVRAACAAE
jgi:PAS domain S-box-containing protein